MLRWIRFIGSFMLAMTFIATPVSTRAATFVGVSVNVGPPALPVYAQPPCPGPDLIWTPGFWGWGPAGYYWVPGTWAGAPRPGFLWTPGYWGFEGGYYAWHRGYWGPHVGFYGGVNYGYGYFGVGFVGGGWYGAHFRYNTAVTSVNTTIVRNVYVDKTVVVNDTNTSVNRVSYSGGPQTTAKAPTASEATAATEEHLAPTPEQQEHADTAAGDRNMLASVNNGHPNDAAVAKPLSADSRSANSEPLREEDRQGVQDHVVRPESGGADPKNAQKHSGRHKKEQTRDGQNGR